MKILKYKKIYLSISTILVAFSVTSIIYFGLNLSIDFKGGTVYEVTYSEKVPTIEKVREVVKKNNLELAVIQKKGDYDFIIKNEKFSDEQKKGLRESLNFSNSYPFVEKQIKTIGPSVSAELGNKSLFAIILISIIIILFIWYVFKGVSRPVSSLKFGLVAVVALIHDIIIPTGIFAFLGSIFIDYQIDVLFVTAILAILGFSVNDTIVIFDRIRENLKKKDEKGETIKGKKFRDVVENSLKESLTRSFNTSLTTLFVLGSLFFIGGEVLQPFALVLMLGVIVGTYSSIFLASPLLILIEKYQKPVKEEKKKKEKKALKAELEFSEKDIADALERMKKDK